MKRVVAEHLETYIEFWDNYIPEVCEVAKALLAARETCKVAAAVWEDRMRAVHMSCRNIAEVLDRDGMLDPECSLEEATDLLWTVLSIRNREHLTVECGWTTDQYIGRTQELLEHIFRGNYLFTVE